MKIKKKNPFEFKFEVFGYLFNKGIDIPIQIGFPRLFYAVVKFMESP